MFILVKDSLPLMELDKCELILQLNKDGKTFKILRKDGVQLKNVIHHNSMLKHFILSVSPYPEEVDNEETDRVSRGQA
jgi:hypothetical protein